MSFFDDVDSTGVVEDHIRSVLSLEEEQAKTIMRSYQEVRRELRDRLDSVRGNSFTAQHLRGVLAQVQGAIEAMNSKLAGDTIAGAEEAAMQGIDDLVDEIKKFNQKFTGAVTPINLNAALLAKDTANFLVTKYQTNLDAYGNDLMTQISNGLFQASIGDASYGEVVGRVGNFFMAEEWKLHRIVRTELHNIYNLGKMNGMSELVDGSISDLMKTLMHPMDSRTGDDSIYAAQKHLVAAIDEPFVYVWKGKRREFMAPPDRPNDRAILVPYREEWGKPRGSAFVPLRA
jgi:hypothetical protein